PVLHRLEDVVIYRVIVPVLNPATQRTTQRRGNQLHSRLHQPASQQTALPPRVPPVAVTHSVWLQAQVEGTPSLRAGQHIPGLTLEGVNRPLLPELVRLPAQLVQTLPQTHPAIEPGNVLAVLEADVGDLEQRIVGVAVDGECLVRRSQVGGAEVRDGWNAD